ncbi:MAG: pyruvate kinase [Nitrospira sp. SCN 59-13]|nr:MAG: pyruvate kinase [Nitrospira sp. SCN 59-13]
MRKAKIVCTIGPASDGIGVLEQLIRSGMNAARLNFSHGTHASHGQAIKVIREAADRQGAAVAIIQDLQGPRIRVGEIDGTLELRVGQRVRLRTMTLRSGGQIGARNVLPVDSAQDIPVTYQALTRDIRPRAKILIDDGLVELTADRIVDGGVECTVVAGGRVTSHKGMNLPGTVVSAPTLTDKDREDVRFGVAQGVDYIALSFVRGAEDIRAAKQLIAECGGDVPVIAKIERQEAVTDLDAILQHADGVMVARGDLGVELGPEAVPVLQKRIIATANRHRRLVITATQMLESMTQHLRPTRAEASDVANAVFDGTDAVMLSAETAVGHYPVEVVQVMDRIVRAAEVETGPGFVRRASPDNRRLTFEEAICLSASSAAAATGATAIVAFSERGTTARLVSKQRPAAPIIGFTPFEPVRRQMALYWGVLPHTMPQIPTTDERVNEAERRLKAEGLATAGQRIVILSGTRIGQPGGTNLMKLHEVG